MEITSFFRFQQLGAPFGVPRCFEVPIVSDLIGGMFDTVNTSSTNETNLAINKMNNQFNAQQAELDRNFQAEQSQLTYDRSVDYSRQVQEYKNAGLNPYLMMSGQNGTVGSAQAASGSRATASQSATMQKSNIGDYIARLAGDMANYNLQGAQEEYYQKEGQRVSAETLKTLWEVKGFKDKYPEMLRQYKATTDSILQGIRQSQNLIELNDSQKQLNNRLSEKANQEIANLSTQNDMMKKEFSFMDENQRLHVKSVLASIFAQYAQGKASLAAAAEAAAMTMTENATRRYKVSGVSWDAKKSKAGYYDLFYSAMKKRFSHGGTSEYGISLPVFGKLGGYGSDNTDPNISDMCPW